MFHPLDLARFAIDEFLRGLDGLTEEEAARRLDKADGTQMNAPAWTTAHLAYHWLQRPERLRRYSWGSDDPTPPTLAEARGWLEEGRRHTEDWLSRADAALMASIPPRTGGESVGTSLMRATLHTWFHIGEINAIRQMLGHPEIGFVGDMIGHLEWRDEDGHPARTSVT